MRHSTRQNKLSLILKASISPTGVVDPTEYKASELAIGHLGVHVQIDRKLDGLTEEQWRKLDALLQEMVHTIRRQRPTDRVSAWG